MYVSLNAQIFIFGGFFAVLNAASQVILEKVDQEAAFKNAKKGSKRNI
jgi:hypothetical protein